ncbi:MAG: hypothetical protein RIG68_23265 [Imperialibacter sp.]|uniref:hypothetical protein n=1 Tax=Imperialibacter sp. TaxID=2038411 RepID=UPI0032EAFB1B
MKLTVKTILIAAFLVLLDVVVYIIFGLLLMRYDDFYDESEGEYWSLSSMTLSEQLSYIGLNIWTAVNLLALAFLAYRTYRLIKKGTTQR